MRDGCCPALQALQAAIGQGRANRLASMRAEVDLMQAAQRRVGGWRPWKQRCGARVDLR